MQTILVIVAGIVLAGFLLLLAIIRFTPRPDHLGAVDGRLAEVPDSPNCVSTMTTVRSHWIEPLTCPGTPHDAMQRLLAVIAEMPSATVIEQQETYLYVEFRSRILGYVDDVEFLIEPETDRIHFRSASRLGHSDFGVNRDRMEQIRRRFQQMADTDR